MKEGDKRSKKISAKKIKKWNKEIRQLKATSTEKGNNMKSIVADWYSRTSIHYQWWKVDTIFDVQDKKINYEVKPEYCIKCMKQPVESFFLPCGHACLCSGCNSAYMHCYKCPACNSSLTSKLTLNKEWVCCCQNIKVYKYYLFLVRLTSRASVRHIWDINANSVTIVKTSNSTSSNNVATHYVVSVWDSVIAEYVSRLVTNFIVSITLVLIKPRYYT